MSIVTPVSLPGGQVLEMMYYIDTTFGMYLMYTYDTSMKGKKGICNY
jgi:hypothetical protein